MKTILKTVLALIAVSCAVAVLATRWEEVSAVLAGTSWSLLGLAAVGLLAYQFVNAGVWSTVLAALGTRPGFWSAARVWIESEALRWVPGGIWGYGSRVLSAPSLGVGKGTASASLVVEIILTNLAWAAAALLLLGAPWTGEFLEAVLHSGWIDVAALASAVIVALTVAILATRTGRSAAGRLLDSLLRRVPWQELRWRPVLGAFAAYAALCFFNGSVLWLTVQAVPGLDISPLETIGIAGAAWLIGFWAIGVPGGIGVREGALAWLLAHSGSLEAGMAVAVLWRALQVVVELAALGTAALTRAIPARRERREFGVLRVFNF